MMRLVNCAKLGKQAPGLEEIPYPGELGERIFETISAEAWQNWLERLVMIVNETQLNSSEPRTLMTVEKHMIGYLFAEGDYGDLPEGYIPR